MRLKFSALLPIIVVLGLFQHALASREQALEGPKRRLLGTRTISGAVWWADNSQRIAGATVKAFDNDVIGRDTMGSATTRSDGTYTITYTDKDWDSCCFSATRPDIVLEVYIDGKLYAKTNEISNVGSSLSNRNIAVSRYIAKGKLFWQETCTPAVGASALVYDADVDPDDFMGRGTTNSLGEYGITLPRNDGTSAWDPLGGRPDPYVKFTGPYGSAGQTGEKSDVSAVTLDYGTVYKWRNDPSAAKVIAAAINGNKQDWISVTEYTHCEPKKLVVTIKLDIGRALFSKPSTSQMPRLKQLLKDGIAENWSRTGPRAINVPGHGVFDVHANVIEDPDGYSVSLKWASDVEKSCERSHNVGAPALGLDLTLWYNAGCAKYADPVNWQAIADRNYKDTAAHEFGHSVLMEAVSTTYSWTHKGSSTLLQAVSSSATNYPATGDVDIMQYYKNGSPPSERTYATAQDVRRLIGIAETSYLRACGSCPYGSALRRPPPPPKRPSPPPPRKIVLPPIDLPPLLLEKSPPPPDKDFINPNDKLSPPPPVKDDRLSPPPPIKEINIPNDKVPSPPPPDKDPNNNPTDKISPPPPDRNFINPNDKLSPPPPVKDPTNPNGRK